MQGQFGMEIGPVKLIQPLGGERKEKARGKTGAWVGLNDESRKMR